MNPKRPDVVDLDVVEARLGAITPGDWDWSYDGLRVQPDGPIVVGPDMSDMDLGPTLSVSQGDGAFIVFAPEMVRTLIADLKATRAELAEALATLANERGTGPKPAPGWTWIAPAPNSSGTVNPGYWRSVHMDCRFHPDREEWTVHDLGGYNPPLRGRGQYARKAIQYAEALRAGGAVWAAYLAGATK